MFNQTYKVILLIYILFIKIFKINAGTQQNKRSSTDIIWHGSCFYDVYKKLRRNGDKTAICRRFFMPFHAELDIF